MLLWTDRLTNSQTLKDRATQLPTNTRVELSECNINANIHGSPLDLYWSSHGMIKLFYIANNWLSRSRRQTSDYFHWDSQISTDIILLIRWSESLIVIVKWSNLRVWVRLSDSYRWISTNQLKKDLVSPRWWDILSSNYQHDWKEKLPSQTCWSLSE